MAGISEQVDNFIKVPTTWTVGAGGDFMDLASAWEFANIFRVSEGGFITIQLLNGTHNLTETLSPHPDGAKVEIAGQSGRVPQLSDYTQSATPPTDPSIQADAVTNHAALLLLYPVVLNVVDETFYSSNSGVFKIRNLLIVGSDGAGGLTTIANGNTYMITLSGDAVVIADRVAIHGGHVSLVISDTAKFVGDNIAVGGNTTGASNDAVAMSREGKLYIEQGVIQGVTFRGIYMQNSPEVILRNVDVQNCISGVDGTCSKFSITGGTFSKNAVLGVRVTGAVVHLFSNRVEDNGGTGAQFSGCVGSLSGSRFNNNTGRGLEVTASNFTGVVTEAQGNASNGVRAVAGSTLIVNDPLITNPNPAIGVVGNNNSIII